MNPTRLRQLVGGALAALVVVFVIVHLTDSTSVRQPPTALVVTMSLAASGTFIAGSSLRVRLSGRPGSTPILPIAVARMAALGIATAITGALVAGAWAGFLIDRLTIVSGNDAARHDSVVAGLGLLSGLLLALAGQRLQRLCRSPGGPWAGAGPG